MKEKIIGHIKMGVIIAVLFAMGVSSVFPSYWRTACSIWFAVLTIAEVNEIYRNLKKNQN